MLPSSLAASDIHDFSAAASVISTAAPVALTPSAFNSATVLATCSALRAQTATPAPSAASVPAIARPMPRVPPSTTAFFPLRPKSICFSFVERDAVIRTVQNKAPVMQISTAGIAQARLAHHELPD